MNHPQYQTDFADSFPGIDLTEPSSRPGANGQLRYVRYRDGLGDIDSGRFIFPKKTEVHNAPILFDRNEEAREIAAIVNGD